MNDYYFKEENFQKPLKKSSLKKIFSNKVAAILGGIFLLVCLMLGGFYFYWKGSGREISKQDFAISALPVFEKVVKFLPIEQDKKKEMETATKLAEALSKQDGVERIYFLMLQNNMELRPGGGFFGQYAVVKVKNGKVTSLFLEDVNLLDQRIEAKIAPPYPFLRKLSLKKWKMRDSNFSPDFSTNVEKAKYFYRLSGSGAGNFDGVIAVNATVLNSVLALTGPITISGLGEYNSDNAVLKIEEQVEKAYLADKNLDDRNRKWVIKKLAPVIVDKLFSLGNISKIVDMGLQELQNKNVMLSFKDPELQKMVEEVHWDGKVNTTWDGDYLMAVDASMGALKSDYYVKRSILYEVDLTAEKPGAHLTYTYDHTARVADWRTSDYHTYLRVYAPQGSTLKSQKMVRYPITRQEFGKTYFGFDVDAVMNRQTKVEVFYELPDSFKNRQDYKLLIQKQSGMGDVPVSIKIKTPKGEFNQDTVLKKDLQFETKTFEEEKK